MNTIIEDQLQSLCDLTIQVHKLVEEMNEAPFCFGDLTAVNTNEILKNFLFFSARALDEILDENKKSNETDNRRNEATA